MTMLRVSARTAPFAIGCVFIALVGCATSPARPTAPPLAPPPPAVVADPDRIALEQWSARFPAASEALRTWVDRFPEASPRVIDWDAGNPGQTKELVIWALAYPGKTFPEFADTHPQWPDVRALLPRQQPSIDAFLRWCRAHPQASRALFDHPGGLAWVTRHGPAD